MESLQTGDSGPEVAELQQHLATLGYQVNATGEFDQETHEAVKHYQEYCGVEATGVADTDVRQYIQTAAGTTSQQAGGYDQAGYQQAGYDQTGYQQAGYDQAGYDQAGYQQAGYQQAGYDQAGYDQAGYQQAGHDQATAYTDTAHTQAETAPEQTSGVFGGACDATTPLPIHSTLTVGPKTTVEIGFRSMAGSVNVSASSRYAAPPPPVIREGQEDYRVTLMQCGAWNTELATQVAAIGSGISFSSGLPSSTLQTGQFFFKIKNGSGSTDIEVTLNAT